MLIFVGERTPVSRQLLNHAPERWNFCQNANKFHAEFLKTIQRFIPNPDAPMGSDIAKWQNFIFTNTHETMFDFRNSPLNKKNGTEFREDTCDYGQLTDVGQASMNRAGKFLRSLYVDQLGFMPSNLPTNGSLYLRSTEYTRSIESINMLMDGFYPTSTQGPMSGGSLDKIKLNVRPKMLDNLPILYDLQWSVELTPEARKRSQAKYRGFIDQVHKDLVSLDSIGKDLDELIKNKPVIPYHFVFDTLIEMRAHGLALPKGLTPGLVGRAGQVAFIDMIFSKDISQKCFYLQNKPIAKLVAGNVLDAVLSHQSEPNSPGHRRMSVFSAHDTTILPLLLTFGDNETVKGLGPVNMVWPPLSSTIRIELFKDNMTKPQDSTKKDDKDSNGSGLQDIKQLITIPNSFKDTKNYYVRVHYMDRVVQLPACQKPGTHHPKMGSEMCTMDAFFKQIANIVPDNMSAEVVG